MKLSLLYIFSLLFSLVSAVCTAQQDTTQIDTTSVVTQNVASKEISTSVPDSTRIDSTTVDAPAKKKIKKERVKRPDSLKIKIKSGLQFALDYGKLATLISDFEQKFEVGIGFQFSNRFQPNFQYGIGTIEPEAAIDNGTYKSEGSYWRAGINYLIPLDNINTLFVGMKYGASEFDDSGSYEVTSELWDTFEESFSRSGFTATWYSVILGSEKRLMDGKLILGGQTGVRFLLERDEADFIDAYTIPGYGLTANDGSPFLNLYIKYQLSF